MKYKSFKIKNYKGIHEVIIDLANNRIITLVGLNESGKTTIMEAINLFYSMIKGKNPTTTQLNLFRPKGIDFTGDIEISATLLLENDDITEINKYWKDQGKKTKLNIPEEFIYTFKFKFDLHTYKETKRNCTFDVKTSSASNVLSKANHKSWNDIVNFIKKDIIPEVLFYEDFIFNIPEKIEFMIGQTPEEKPENNKNKEWQLVFDDILKAINPKLSFKEHIVDIWHTDNDTAVNRLSKIEDELNKKITKAWKELFQKDSEKLNFKEIKIKPEAKTNSIDFSFKVKTDSGKVFSINERSKGCKWFFSFLIFTEFRKNRTKIFYSYWMNQHQTSILLRKQKF